MSKILEMGRHLPGPVIKILRPIYKLWSNQVELDKEIIQDIAFYFNISEKEVVWLAKRAEKFHCLFWKILNPKTKEEINNFYQSTPFYIFELAFWHMKKSQRSFRQEIIKWAKGNVLDFGAGLGDLSLALKKRGFNVDYADISGKTFNFAKWLFQKRGFQIKMIDLSKEKLSKQYETIYCIDVVEHLVDPKEMLRDLAGCLKSGGRLIITNIELNEISEIHPMHLKVGVDIKDYLNSLGLFQEKEPWLWVKNKYGKNTCFSNYPNL